MPKRQDDAAADMPNQAANKEKAEGSRPEEQSGGGITNRPLEQERREQRSVPPRGENTEGGHA